MVSAVCVYQPLCVVMLASTERKAVVDIPVNLTCNDECIPFESSRQLELLSRMHRFGS